MTTATVAVPRRLGLPLRALGDERLVRLAAAGDQDALAVIFERHHQALYRYCRALLGNGEDAEDALQSAMARVVRALPGETRELALKPWLYRIAHNEAMRIAGRRRPQATLDEAPEVAARPDTEDRESRERLGELLTDLRELSDRQRGALVLRELEGASFGHIASVFGGSEAAAKQTVYEARLCLADFARGRAMECDQVTHALSDGDRRKLRGRPVRAHLRACEECAAFAQALRLRPQELRALAPPLAAPAAAALLAKFLSGGGGGAGGGLAASSAAGGALASFSLPSFVLKGMATMAVATVVAAGAHQLPSGLPGGGSAPATISEGEAGARAGARDDDGAEDGRRVHREDQRGQRDSAGRHVGGTREERAQSAGEATREENLDRSGGREGDTPVSDRRRDAATGVPGRGRGARPDRTPVAAPRRSAPSPAARLRPVPAPRGGTKPPAPATTPARPVPRAPALPSVPGVVDTTRPVDIGRDSGSRP
ncbi:MAG: sigma-70 family RNA polymerase sigma factor [Actinomycetota bacterium]|nr:sigma-70 family RNA polymerase sigma factor [Actinomycetota bacterium]